MKVIQNEWMWSECLRLNHRESVRARVSCHFQNALWKSGLPLFPPLSFSQPSFICFKGCGAAAVGDTADGWLHLCVCQYISGIWKVFEWKASPGAVVVTQSLMIHVINSKTKWKNKRRTSMSFISLFFFFPFSGSFLTGGYKLVCVWQGVDLHTQQELHVVTRTHQERAIKTTPCQLAVKTGGEELHELNKDWKLNSINIC